MITEVQLLMLVEMLLEEIKLGEMLLTLQEMVSVLVLEVLLIIVVGLVVPQVLVVLLSFKEKGHD